VAALDLPGHGQSSTDVGGGSLDELAATVEGYADAVGIERAHLIGHSMGAAVCLALLDRAPQRVTSLTLIGPAGIGQKINADFIRGFVAADGREALEPLMRMLFADPGLLLPGWVDEALAFKGRPGATEALARIAGSRYTGTRAGGTLRDLAGTVPTLVIWGAGDAVIPPPAAGELDPPGVEMHRLPGRGHMVHLEAGDEVNRLIVEFLRR
jgi:pyruvate dehydrogenase E2 component (dihydrolipoamide acetyltransferase)